MKSTALFGIIAIVAVFSASSVLAADKGSLYDISGKWFVVATRGYKATSPKCWTITISRTATDAIEGAGSMLNTETNEYSESTFAAHESEVTTGWGGDQFHYFDNIKEDYGGGETSALDSMKLWYNKRDPVATLSDVYVGGAPSDSWDILFISRRSDITPDMVPYADNFIDNNC